MAKMYSWIIKGGFLLVIFGFLLPVSCNQSGAQLLQYAFTGKQYLLALSLIFCIIFAVAGLMSGLANRKRRAVDKINSQLFCAGSSCVSGLLPYLGSVRYFKPQIGAYVMATGWILSIGFCLLEKEAMRKK